MLDDLNFKLIAEKYWVCWVKTVRENYPMKILLGLIREYSGEIYYEGNILNHSNVKIMNIIGSLVDAAFIMN